MIDDFILKTRNYIFFAFEEEKKIERKNSVYPSTVIQLLEEKKMQVIDKKEHRIMSFTWFGFGCVCAYVRVCVC